MGKYNPFSDDIDPGPSLTVISPELLPFNRSDVKDLMEFKTSIAKSELSPRKQFFYINVHLKLVPGSTYELYQCAKRIAMVLRTIDPGMELIKLENNKHVYPQNIFLRDLTRKNMQHYISEQAGDQDFFSFTITVTTHIHKVHRYLNHWLRESPHSIRVQVIRHIRTPYIAVEWLLRSTATTVNRADFAEYLEERELKNYKIQVREKHAIIRDGENNILSKEALYIYVQDSNAQAAKSFLLRKGFVFRQQNFSRLNPCPICMESGVNEQRQMIENHIDYLKRSVTVKVQLNGTISTDIEKNVGLMVKKCLRLSQQGVLKINIATIFANKLSFTGSAMYTPSFRDDLQSIKEELNLDFTVVGPNINETKLEKRAITWSPPPVNTDIPTENTSSNNTPIHSNVSSATSSNMPDHKLGSIKSSLNDLNKRVDALERLTANHFNQLYSSINTHMEASKTRSELLDKKLDNNRVFLENTHSSVSTDMASISKDMSKLRSKFLKSIHDDIISSVGDELKSFDAILKDSLSTSKQAFTLAHTFSKEIKGLLKGGIVLPPTGTPSTTMIISSPVSHKTDITDTTDLTENNAPTNLTDKMPVTPTALVHKFNPMAYDETPDEKVTTISEGGSLQDTSSDIASICSDTDSLNYSTFIQGAKDSSKIEIGIKNEIQSSVPATIKSPSVSASNMISSSSLAGEDDDKVFIPVGKTGKPKITTFSEKVQSQKEKTNEPLPPQIKSEQTKSNVKLTKLKQTSLSSLYTCNSTRRHSTRLKQQMTSSVEESKSQE